MVTYTYIPCIQYDSLSKLRFQIEEHFERICVVREASTKPYSVSITLYLTISCVLFISWCFRIIAFPSAFVNNAVIKD